MKEQTILLDNSPIVSKEYLEDAKILNSKISNPSVKNIALVAKLGAGKSSVIETYLDKYRKKQKVNKKDFVNENGKLDKSKFKLAKQEAKSKNKNINKKKYVKISLSTFNGNGYDEEAVERSILQQLLYSQSKQKLPNSQIERTNKPSLLKSIIFASLLTLFVISSILFGIELSGINILPKIEWMKFLFLGIMTVSFGYILFHCIYFKSLKKVKYKDFEIETKIENGSNSIINKLIDEILYFFECIDVDLVIFEDLDRLPNTEIFVKLRELNTILNNSSNRKCKKITFLYAVKSELIENVEERAKFFDFILSIVPIVNPSNTAEKIREFVKTVDNKEKNLKLSEDYIKDISLYISDMRILKNTFNDYIITRNRVVNERNKERMSNEKLFTLSLYRNLFPAEYTKLENKEGVLPILLNKKKLAEVFLKEIDNKILKLEKQIIDANNEQMNDFEELKFLLNGILLEASYSSYSAPQTKVKDIDTFNNVDFKTLEHPKYNGHCVILSTRDLEKISLVNFSKREENIKLKSEKKIQEAKLRLEELNKQKQFIYNFSYEEIVDKLGIERVFNNEKITEDKDFSKSAEDIRLLNFLKFIIKNKYIDDKYSEYTHNLNSSIISQSDIEFIKNVQNDNSDYNYQIENVEEVVSRLKKEDFKYSSVINKTILKNINLLDKFKRESLLNTLASKNEESFKLLLEFFTVEEEIEIVKLVKNLKSDIFLASSVVKSSLTDNKKDIIINTLFKCVEDLSEINIDQCMTNYISSKNQIDLLFQDLSFDRIKQIFNIFKPIFINLSENLTTNDIITMIIQNNYYEININNIMFILKIEEKNSSNLFSNIMQFINTHNLLQNYINDNLNIFTTNILLNDKIVNSKENSVVITKLIFNPDIKDENKIHLIQKYDILIEDVSLVDNSLLTCLVLNSKIKLTWSNIQYIFDKLENKALLILFIQKNVNDLPDISIENDNRELLLYIINNIKEEDVLASLLNKIVGVFTLMEISNYNNALILLKLKKVEFLTTDFELLIENDELLIEYLCCFENEISQCITSFFTNKLTSEIINKILFNDQISTSLKQKIIIQFSNKLKIIGFEMEYASLFIDNKFIINENILFQFTSFEGNIDKFSLVGLTNFDYTNPSTISQIKEFLVTCGESFKELFEKKKEFKIANTNKNINILLKLQRAKLLNYSKYKDKVTIKIV